MNESEYVELRETAWRRSLTADERSRLQSYLLIHPDAQHDWEEEAALNQVLANLPDAPLSSNFTARVLEAMELEERREQRKSRSGNWLGRLRSWIPRVAVAALVVGLGALGYQGIQINSLREKAKYLDTLASVASTLSDAKIWDDFDAIARLDSRTSPEPRYEPVAAMQDEILWAALAPSAQ